jgi:uncharacterized damage-inducible protein DinB
MMRRHALVISIAPALLLAATAAVAQVAPKGTGFKAEYLAELTVAEDHLVRLAEAIPADKYTWRPAPGVRSFAEVFLHVAGSNFNLPPTLGVAPKEGMLPAAYWTSTTDKTKIVADLKRSFVFLREGIDKLTDADAEKKMPWFDGENTYRGILYFFTRHTGEHSGQLVAYARVNGIVPPWSEGR